MYSSVDLYGIYIPYHLPYVMCSIIISLESDSNMVLIPKSTPECASHPSVRPPSLAQPF